MKLIHYISGVSLILMSSLSHSASSTTKGSTPNGKPFAVINDKIVEIEGAVSTLEEQVDLLVGTVDTLAARVGANEDAIYILQIQNIDLQNQITANVTDIENLQTDIDGLVAENDSLQTQINTLGDNDGSLKEQIDINNGLVSSMELVLAGISSSLQGQIDHNKNLIAVLDSEIDTINSVIVKKQEIIDGSCPLGSSIRAINPDGSVVCESDGVSGGTEAGEASIHTTVVYAAPAKIIAGTYSAIIPLECPAGYIATGYGFSGFSISLVTAAPTAHNQYSFRFKNNATVDNSPALYLRCISIVNS